MHTIKKICTIFCLLIFVTRLFVPFIAYADDATPTPTPSPTSTSDTTVSEASSPTDTPTPTPEQSTPTLTPTPTDSPTPSVTPTSQLDTDITPTPDASQSADVSSNTIPSVTPSSTPDNSSSQTTTGNATAVTQAENDLNTTAINSQAVNQTINIFLPQDGTVDLSDPSKIAANVVSANNENGEVFNISIVNNNAYVNTDVVSIANTGNNASSGSGEFAINTGNATSLVQLVNKVNVTLVNSEIHFITINIYGILTGNIILPTPSHSSSSQNCPSCGSTTTADNQAAVTSNVASVATTGSNTVDATGNAAITTGNATAQVNIINIINQLIFGLSINYLIINDLGTWNGNFLGWGDLPAANGGTSLSLSPSTPTSDNTSSLTTVSNTTTVTNTISSRANTGNNSITTSSGNGMILTGNAQSIVSLINLVNTTFINTKAIFAFINIFGTFTGDIGDASKFITPTPTPDNSPSNTLSQKEDGGALTVTNMNNTGPYVLPGDTVTFFLTVHNSGTGKVYGAHLHLSLIKDGVEGGAADYNLGDLAATKSIRMTTGLVLSTSAPAGVYTARAVVMGTTGENDTPLQVTADSTFRIFVPSYTNDTVTQQQPQLPAKTVLAAHTPEDSNSTNWLMVILIGITVFSITLRILKNRQYLIYALTHTASLKERLHALRLFFF